MDVRLSIDQITPDTPKWTCKVQIIDMSRERQSRDKKIKFQNLLLEDEEEQQIRAVIYGNDIGYYAGKLQLFNTYLVSMARVKVSSSTYGRPIHKFHWVIDKETMVEHIKPTAELDVALPPPTKLNTTPFDQLRRMTPSPGMEIDFIGVILACGPSKYAGRTQTRCREVTLTDERENQLLLTLWDDFYNIEGSKLESKVKGTNKLPVLLGRNIGVSPYQGLTLQTRFNSTICLNPPYPQALELLDRAQANQQRLSARSLPHGPTSATAVATPPDGHSVITIAQLTAEASVGVFHVEAEMSIPDDLQKFCVLECSGCKQKKRTKELREFDCPKCQKKTTLMPRCTFQVDLMDGSGSTTAFISGDLAKKLIAMPAVHIFQTTYAKQQLLDIKHAQDMLGDKLFYVQLRKTAWMSANVTQSTLTILNYMEKECALSEKKAMKEIRKGLRHWGNLRWTCRDKQVIIKETTMLGPLNHLTQPKRCTSFVGHSFWIRRHLP